MSTFKAGLQRPIGVSIISILGMAGSAIGIIIAIILIVLALTSPSPGPRGAGGEFFAFIAGLVLLIISVPTMIINIGLFRMKPWSRIVTIVMSGITIVLAVGVILLGIGPLGSGYDNVFGTVDVIAVIIAIINAIVIFYLARASVTQAFSGA